MEEIKRGDFYWCDFGQNEGSEANGKRPCIIIQNDKGNQASTTTIVAPLTTKLKANHIPTHIFVSTKYLPKPSNIVLEQIRTIDKNRLCGKIGRADAELMARVNNGILISLGVVHG